MFEVAEKDQQSQITQAKDMIRKGAKVLIVVCVDQNEAAQIVELAHQENVKVIAYDRLIKGCQLDYYVSANSTRIGEFMATYLTSLEPKGKYALIPGSKYDDNAMKIFLGQMNVLQPFMESGDIQLVYSEFTEDWTPAEGALHTNAIFDQNPEGITAILAGSDAITDGVLQVLKEKQLEGKVLVSGQDAELDNIKAIIRGEQTCDGLKPLTEMAKITAEIAIAIANGEALDMNFTLQSNGKAMVKSIILDAVIVNKNNIESTVIASGFHTSAEINQ